MSIPYHPAFNYINEAATVAADITGTAWRLAPDGISGGSFHTSCDTGGSDDAAGAFRVYTSNDPRCDPNNPDNADAEWFEISSELSITAVTDDATSKQVIRFSDLREEFIRLDWDHTGGTTLAVRVWAAGCGH